MSDLDWKVVQVVVYPPGVEEHARMEQTVRLPYDADFDDLLAALADSSPGVFAEVSRYVERATAHLPSQAGDDPPLLALDHYFGLGGPIVCPDFPDGIA